MWPFKKKKVIEAPLKKQTLKLVLEDKEIELGITRILLTFKDGQVLLKNIYGTYNQSFDYGRCEGQEEIYGRYKGYKLVIKEMQEPTCSEINITNSLKNAEIYINPQQFFNYHNNSYTTGNSLGYNSYADDEKNPTITVNGEVITAIIKDTIPYKETVKVAKIVPVKDN